MSRTRKAQREEENRAAAKALQGATAVMVRRGPYDQRGQEAGDLLDIVGYIAVVKLASGPYSGKVREYPATWVRPAEAFEVVGEVTA